MSTEVVSLGHPRRYSSEQRMVDKHKCTLTQAWMAVGISDKLWSNTRFSFQKHFPRRIPKDLLSVIPLWFLNHQPRILCLQMDSGFLNHSVCLLIKENVCKHFNSLQIDFCYYGNNCIYPITYEIFLGMGIFFLWKVCSELRFLFNLQYCLNILSVLFL